MEISRLMFSKETKKKINEGLNGNQKGVLRWNRIKEAEEKGYLMHAKNRYEVANIAGFTEEDRERGYQWVSNQITRKHLSEVVIGTNKNHKFEYEYHVISDPDYRRDKARAAAAKKNKEQGLTKEEQSVRERGRIIFTKLKELEASGDLAKATCRADIATLVGYDEDRAKAGYSWVSNMINRGHLNEKMINVSPSGKMVYEYKLSGTEPSYKYEESQNRKMKKHAAQKRWQDKVADAQISQVPEEPQIIERARIGTPIKIEITRGNTIIKIEMEDQEQVGKLITTILKGE